MYDQFESWGDYEFLMDLKMSAVCFWWLGMKWFWRKQIYHLSSAYLLLEDGFCFVFIKWELRERWRILVEMQNVKRTKVVPFKSLMMPWLDMFWRVSYYAWLYCLFSDMWVVGLKDLVSICLQSHNQCVFRQQNCLLQRFVIFKEDFEY